MLSPVAAMSRVRMNSGSSNSFMARQSAAAQPLLPSIEQPYEIKVNIAQTEKLGSW